ncbi:pentapeptide repeat-containing protein [Frigoriglobus tundricola]|uniref:Pentapeptide repeat family protein n=1 Tax=Frigoriglobus tundricola TaxID=2774151 RepID=A0A6M5YKF1_9BACT|nr:pentapeptide repeat-containing protein [Frigoriglobus tundricola]QJW93781.1 Pentapeptide repeat family protein [Frigoriglobus tundricola]
MRKSLEGTWLFLESQHADVPRHPDGRPFIRDRVPSVHDEEPLGFSYFRSGLEGADRSHLTMPRTLFSRSWLVGTTFAGTDLSESCMCWNDFDACDFSGADLSGCDMRASHFRGCKFAGALLRGADLRRSSFEGCDFTGADLLGAVAEAGDSDGCVHDSLSREQQAVMALSPDEGPEPPGG